MKNINQVFSSLVLSSARDEAKRWGIKLPKISAYNYSSSHDYEVFIGGYQHALNMDLTKGIIWRGQADSASDAKAKGIYTYLEKYNAIKIIIECV